MPNKVTSDPFEGTKCSLGSGSWTILKC